MPSNMCKPKFSQLSQLVLVDIAAALPMAHGVRMALLGNDGLRQTCSLKWVTARMADVSFEALVLAHRFSPTREVFCSEPVRKRLYGRCIFDTDKFRYGSYSRDCKELAEKVPGWLHIHVKISRHDPSRLSKVALVFITTLDVACKLLYVTGISQLHLSDDISFMNQIPELIFAYNSYYRLINDITYRPALLKGRHVLDVLRAVCGPADVSEADLEYSRRKVTLYCKRINDILRSTWHEPVLLEQRI